MLIFDLLKTTDGETAFGLAKKIPKEINPINNKNPNVIITKNALCLFFGDIKTTAMLFSMNKFLLVN